MKKLLLSLVAIFALSTFSASAETKYGIFNHVGVGVHAATTGVGFEVALPVTPYLQLRGGMEWVPGITFKTDVDGTVTVNNIPQDITVNLKGDLKRTQESVLLNVYPMPSKSFFLCGGFYFGGQDLITVTGHSDEVAQLSSAGVLNIGDYNLPIDAAGNAAGVVRVKSTRPYLGLGFGRPCPKNRVNCMFELGVQFHGKPQLLTESNGVYEPLDKVVNVGDDDTMAKILNKVTVYPVLKFTITGRIF